MKSKSKMSRKLKDRWVRALRSRRYKQGTGDLRIKDSNGTRFCCLGVLCNVINHRNWIDESGWALRPKDEEDPEIMDAIFTTEMRQFVGLSDKQHFSLIAMNDGDGVEQRSFREIADWIEENV